MKTHQRYAMKFLGVSFLVTIVVGGVFGLLASNSTGSLPTITMFVGGVLNVTLIGMILFKYVYQMMEDQISPPKQTS